MITSFLQPALTWGKQLYFWVVALTVQRETNTKNKFSLWPSLELFWWKAAQNLLSSIFGCKGTSLFSLVMPCPVPSLVQPVLFASGCFPNWWRSLWILKLCSRNLSTLSLPLSWNWLLICKLPFWQLWNRWRHPRSSMFTDHLSLFFSWKVKLTS